MIIPTLVRDWRGNRQSLIQHLDMVLGPKSREKIMAEFDMEEENGGQIRHTTGVQTMRLSGLYMGSQGGTGATPLHTRQALRPENQNADADGDYVRSPSSAQLERVPRMDNIDQAPKAMREDDAAKVADTLGKAIASRREMVSTYEREIAEFRREITKREGAIAEIKGTVKILEKSASKLRRG